LVFSYIFGDDFISSGEQKYVFSAFMDTRNVQPVYVDPQFPDEYETGTVYPYADVLLQDPFAIDASPLLGIVQGTCTRTNGNFTDESEGRGFCQLTFEMLDVDTVVASFTAEGPILNDDIVDSTLTVTGGLGELHGVSGKVLLYSSFLDYTLSPPVMVPDDTVDVLAGGDGYTMYAELSVLFNPDFADWIPVDDQFTVDDFYATDDYFQDDYISFDDFSFDDILSFDDIFLTDAPSPSLSQSPGSESPGSESPGN
jgi:hypothetical protein